MSTVLALHEKKYIFHKMTLTLQNYKNDHILTNNHSILIKNWYTDVKSVSAQYLFFE